jgi:KRAB domain-containing zinc finger protein
MTHYGEWPFQSDQCNYTCIKSANMKIHKMTHSGEKRFKCTQCDYLSKTSSHMKKHKMTHSGVKLFKCNLYKYSCVLVVWKYTKWIIFVKRHLKLSTDSCITSRTMKIHKGTDYNWLKLASSAFSCSIQILAPGLFGCNIDTSHHYCFSSISSYMQKRSILESYSFRVNLFLK